MNLPAVAFVSILMALVGFFLDVASLLFDDFSHISFLLKIIGIFFGVSGFSLAVITAFLHMCS